MRLPPARPLPRSRRTFILMAAVVLGVIAAMALYAIIGGGQPQGYCYSS